MSGGLFDNVSPERQRQYEADCAHLDQKRTHVAELIDRLFAEEIAEEATADLIADREQHQAEIERYRTFCRAEGLPDRFPCHPLDVCAHLIDRAADSSEAMMWAYLALDREHRIGSARGEFPNPMDAISVRTVMRGLTKENNNKKELN